MKSIRFIIAFIVTIAGISTLQAKAYYVKISEVHDLPATVEMLTISGRVVSESPVKITDGSGEIELYGVEKVLLGDHLVVTGRRDGKKLAVSKATLYAAPAYIEMVYVAAGPFLMGNPLGNVLPRRFDEHPQHTVFLSGYWIGKYEVTRGEYDKFIKAGGYQNPSYWDADAWAWIVATGRTKPECWESEQDWGTGTFFQTARHPVVNVAYCEAEAFCRWARVSLPTEAQWEKAASWTGERSTVYPWGDVWDPEKCNNWYDTFRIGRETAPVGSYPAGVSPYGCYDMAGNVWEWCKDWYQYDYYSQTPPGGWVDPEGPPSGPGRVYRCGSWYRRESEFFRCSDRTYASEPRMRHDGLGFRVAR